ncbi:MAG: hypothetical protein LBE12_07070 [Planctomycetaceae bacterium]|jgi:hypothetical protein|nr:hypothetical protein [Planctomycetaceae bacterium]
MTFGNETLKLQKTEIEIMSSDKLFTIKEAGEWATRHIGKNVTSSNISYLIQYGRIKKIVIYQ